MAFNKYIKLAPNVCVLYHEGNMQNLKLIFMIVFGFWTSYGHTCSCATYDPKELYSKAKSVFMARVISAELINGNGGLQNTGNYHVLGRYQTQKIFKGNPPKFGKVLDAEHQGGNCSVGLLVSGLYIFFLHEGNTISVCDGSGRVQSSEQIELLNSFKESSM
ncbi:MAG: hypothetical protein P8Y45_16755 [Exilibacterium sp.]